jgi:dihydrofolate synthase/folylpolyglutamate synthase
MIDVTWLEQLQPGPKRHDLQAIKSLARKLQITQFSIPVITVTGTNGKGSTVAALASIYIAAGYRVGVFTSPHLLKINERIKINDAMITDEDLAALLARIRTQIINVDCNYFDILTLAALIYFQQNKLDLVILEVGVGGRVDPTNIIDATLAIITTVDFDHCNYLGDTLEAIADEKAQIFRAHHPAIIGQFSVSARVQNYAARSQVPIMLAQQDFTWEMSNAMHWSWRSSDETLSMLPTPSILLDNAAIALMARKLMQVSLPVSRLAIEQGLKQIKIQGRFQRISFLGHTIYLDVAHNPQACQILGQRLQQLPCLGKTIALVGMMQDKDHEASLLALQACVDQWFFASLPQPRGASSEQLAASCQRLGVTHFDCYADPKSALAAAMKMLQPADRLIVFGSFLTVSAALRFVGWEGA